MSWPKGPISWGVSNKFVNSELAVAIFTEEEKSILGLANNASGSNNLVNSALASTYSIWVVIPLSVMSDAA